MIDLREIEGEPLDPPVAENNVRQKNITSLPIFEPVPCRSGRIVRQPDRYMFLGKVFEAISIESESDPATYKEAMADVDSAHWVKAMKSEMESMDSNQVWDLVEVPTNIKPIGCKWVYKRKIGFVMRTWLAQEHGMQIRFKFQLVQLQGLEQKGSRKV